MSAVRAGSCHGFVIFQARRALDIEKPPRGKWEMEREINASRVTEVLLDPKVGTYSFHDAISGAHGEIIVTK